MIWDVYQNGHAFPTEVPTITPDRSKRIKIALSTSPNPFSISVQQVKIESLTEIPIIGIRPFRIKSPETRAMVRKSQCVYVLVEE